MYTEMVKILEGGLVGDREKVKNYATVLAKNLDADGETAVARKIRRTLSTKRGALVGLDAFAAQPVDTESRMDLVEVTTPSVDAADLILDRSTQAALDEFVAGYEKRDELLRSGLDISNSLLLYGPPGCGKTTTAASIAARAGLPLVTARLDGLVSSLLGSTAKNIRKVFDFAADRECVLFLDEFDVIAKLRDDKNELGELKRVVNSLLQNIDSFPRDSILIAATNHHELLDSAIWRRFSSVLALSKPDIKDVARLVTKLLADVNASYVLASGRNNDIFFDALAGLSHSDIRTIIFATARNMIIDAKPRLTKAMVLKEAYLHRHHTLSDSNGYLRFLLEHGVTQREIHESLNIPLRTIQSVSKELARNGDDNVR